MWAWLFTMKFRFAGKLYSGSGKGGDETISAECFVLYNEDDLNKHFILLNQTKLSIKKSAGLESNKGYFEI